MTLRSEPGHFLPDFSFSLANLPFQEQRRRERMRAQGDAYDVMAADDAEGEVGFEPTPGRY